MGRFVIYAVAGLIIALANLAWSAENSNQKFVGVSKCASSGCHGSPKIGNQRASWEASTHAKATSDLEGKKAKEYAAALGISDPTTSDVCLPCHSTAFGVEDSRLAVTFDAGDGIQCETCHGAGSAYIESHKKKDVVFESLVALGMRDLRTDKQHEELCSQCHRENAKYEKLKKSNHPKASTSPLAQLEDKMEKVKHWKKKD